MGGKYAWHSPRVFVAGCTPFGTLEQLIKSVGVGQVLCQLLDKDHVHLCIISRVLVTYGHGLE